MASCLDPSEIPFFIEKIPYLLECHQKEYPKTKKVEKLAKKLIGSDFEPTKSKKFVEEVCSWAGKTGPLVRGQVISNNSPEQIAYALCEGYTKATRGGVAEGVECISSLHGLKQSYASKMLRFLLPDRAVILDSIIRTKCGFSETDHGYKKLLKCCHHLLNQARKSQKLFAGFKNNLRVCDIEAALFMYIQRSGPV